MVSVPVLFWMFVILFASIGSMRGWARELLVTFSAILALFILTVLVKYVPFISGLGKSTLLGLQIIVILSMTFFGYQTPNIQRLAAQNRFARDRLQDILLGVFLGALNGWLVIGSIWYYMDAAGYPFTNVISAPTGDAATLTDQMLKSMPPALLGPSTIYFAVALAFAFVLVVFI